MTFLGCLGGILCTVDIHPLVILGVWKTFLWTTLGGCELSLTQDVLTVSVISPTSPQWASMLWLRVLSSEPIIHILGIGQLTTPSQEKVDNMWHDPCLVLIELSIGSGPIWSTPCSPHLFSEGGRLLSPRRGLVIHYPSARGTQRGSSPGQCGSVGAVTVHRSQWLPV